MNLYNTCDVKQSTRGAIRIRKKQLKMMNLYWLMTSDPRVPTTGNWAHLVFVVFFLGGGVNLLRNIVKRSGIKALIFSCQSQTTLQ